MKLLKVTPLHKPSMYINPTYLISVKPHGNHGCDLRVFGENGGPVGSLEKTEILHVMETVQQIIEKIHSSEAPKTVRQEASVKEVPPTESSTETSAGVFAAVTDNWVTNGISNMFSKTETETDPDNESAIIDLDATPPAQPGVLDGIVNGISDYFKSPETPEPVQEDIPGGLVIYDPSMQDKGVFSSVSEAAGNFMSSVAGMFSAATTPVPDAATESKLRREEKVKVVLEAQAIPVKTTTEKSEETPPVFQENIKPTNTTTDTEKPKKNKKAT